MGIVQLKNKNKLRSGILMRYNVLILLVIILTSNVSFAQTDSLTIHTINNKDYYIYVVEKGASLYAIHKKYNVPMDLIKKENPSVLDGLSIGEKVFIPVKRDLIDNVEIDGNFINHKVEKKQTLYSIAKLYAVKQREIILANPEIEQGLKEGVTIKIPVATIKKEKREDLTQNNELTHKKHLIKKKETFYSLSKLYNVSIDSIKMVNGGLKKGLKIEETIFIPIKEKSIISDETISSALILNQLNSIIGDSVVKKSEYKIGLMLPFYLDENDKMNASRNAFKKKGIYPRSKFAIEFYNGFLMGLDSLSSDSIRFKLYVYDTKGKDSVRTKELLLKEEFKSFDLIVGPLYSANFEEAAELAKQYEIPIIFACKAK